MNQEDDASYKLLFSAPELVRDIIMGFIPDEWLHSLDYDTLEKMPGSYVTDDFRHRADDDVWRVKVGGDWVYLYLLIADIPHPPFILLYYFYGYIFQQVNV